METAKIIKQKNIRDMISNCLYHKIISEIKKDNYDFLYLSIHTFIELEPNDKKILNIMKLTNYQPLYNFYRSND